MARLDGTTVRVGTARVVALALVVVAVLLSGWRAADVGAAGRATSALLYAQHGCTFVYSSPSTRAAPVTALLGGADVTDLGASSNGWRHVKIWSGIEGYIQAADLAAKPPASAQEINCEYPGVPDPHDDILPADRGPWPLTASVRISAPATVYPRPDDSSLPSGALALGTRLDVTAWASDALGRPWYQVRTSGVQGWIWSGAARVVSPDPATHVVSGKPIWSRVAGKGMWFTNYLPHHSDVNALMRAAKLAGITHVYAEVAISTYGFYARNALDRLLPAAHDQGIAVIAWVYPYLKDVSADVRMTQQVAAYVTPDGLRADGVATDVEETDDSAGVYTYGQALRALLGPDALMVSAVYHAYAQTYYPYAAIAASWNVLAPMDYWHSRANRQYSAQQVAHFVGNSLLTVRAALGALGDNPTLPIEELGQTYDMYTADGANLGNAPAGSEITADMQTAKDDSCIGVSFFEWQTASQEEWAAISAFPW